MLFVPAACVLIARDPEEDTARDDGRFVASEIRQLGKHAMVYGVGIAVGRLAGLIMLPIYTRFLTQADYGVLELLTVTVDFLGTIASVGIGSAVFKFYTDAETDDEKRALVSTASLALMGLTACLALLGFVGAPFLSDIVLGADGQARYFQLFFVIYLLQSIEAIPLLYLRARNRSVAFATINVVRLILSLSLNIYFVVHLRLGVPGVLYSSLITGAVFSSSLAAYLFRATGVRFVREHARRLLRFGAPMVAWFLSNFLIVFSDRYFLKNFAGAAAVGIYSVSFRFAILINAFGFRPFNLVWGPRRFEIAKRADGLDTIRKVFGYLNVILGLVAALIILFAGDAIRILTPAPFHVAARAIAPLVVAQVLYHLVAFPNLSMLLTERTRVLGSVAFVTAAIVLSLNYALIPRFGFMGAAYATLIAYGLRFIIVWAVAQRIHRLEYGWGHVATTYAVLGVPVAIKLLLPVWPLLPSIALSASLAVAGTAGLYSFVLTDTERAFARSMPQKALSRLGLARR